MEKDDAWEDFYDRYSIRSLYKDLDEYIERYNKPKSLIVMSDNIIKTRIYEIDQGDQPSCVKLLPDYKTVQLFLKSNLLYVNNKLVKYPKFLLFPTDLIQEVISK